MNTSAPEQNNLLTAYLYASQQLLVANEFEQQWPSAFARIGEALHVTRIYVYRQSSLSDGTLQTWHEYSWHTYTPTFVTKSPNQQGLIHRNKPVNHWQAAIAENGYLSGIRSDFSAEERQFLAQNDIMSMLIVPVSVDGERWGIIGFDDCEQERLWSADEIAILQGLAGMIGTAIANCRLYQAEQKARQHAELIRDLSRLIGERKSRGEIVQHILQELKHIITFDTASIYLTSQDEQPEFIAVSGFTDQDILAQTATKLLKNSPIINKMSQTLQPVISGDVCRLEDWIWVPSAPMLRSFLAVPMVYHQRMLGALMLDSKQIDFFQESDLHIIETLAQHIAISLENARLFARVQLELAQKTAILEASTAVSSSLSFDAILTELATQLCHGIDATSVYIIQLHHEIKTAVIVAEYISDQPAAQRFSSELGRSYAFPDDFIGDTSWLQKGIPYVRHIDDSGISSKMAQHLRRYDGKSILSLPLIIKDQIFGYAQLWQAQHQRPFSEQEIALCVGIAQQAAIAFENSALFAKQEQQLRLSNTLQQVGSLFTATLTLRQVYERIFDLLAQVVEYDNASLQLMDETNTEAYYEVGRGFNNDDSVRRFVNKISKKSIQRVTNPPHWTIINDVVDHPGWIPAPAPLDRTRSWIGAALIIKDRIIGILNVDHHRPYVYTSEIGETVAAFANQAAIAVENTRLYHEVEQRINELTILHRVAQTTASIVDQDKLLCATTDIIMDTMPYHAFGTAFLSAEESGVLIPHQSSHGLTVDPSQIHIPIHASVMGKAIQTGRAILVVDANSETVRYTPDSSTLMQSEVAVPINIQGQAIGVVYIAHPQPNMFSGEDVRFLTTLTGQLSAAIERARLYSGLQQQTDMLAEQVAIRTAELQSERDRIIAILENAGESIILTGMDSLISYVNPAMEQLSGYTRAELMGQHPRLWRSPRTNKTVYKKMWKELRNGRSWRGEVVNLRKDGSEYDALMTIAPLTENGKPVGYVSMQADISRLKEVDRLKSKFVSNVSHELRTPLTNIKTYLTLLERGKPEKRDRYMQVMNQEVDRLARLLQDLLDLSRLEAAPLPAYLPAIDLVAVMENHFAVFSAKAQAKKIKYEVRLPDTPLLVKITADHAGQLFTNLIGNALTYTPENGRIAVRANQECKSNIPYIHICVCDNGPGIEPEDVPHLFERFYRGKGKHNSNVPGTGLGLAICNEIVERYGGSIAIESTLNEGTTVSFWLPLANNSSVT